MISLISRLVESVLLNSRRHFQGVIFNGDGRVCQDIDECATETDQCDEVGSNWIFAHEFYGRLVLEFLP